MCIEVLAIWAALNQSQYCTHCVVAAATLPSFVTSTAVAAARDRDGSSPTTCRSSQKHRLLCCVARGFRRDALPLASQRQPRS